MFPVPPGGQALVAGGSWDSGYETGLDPTSRKDITEMEVPNLMEQAKRRRDKNLDIQEWRL